MTFPFCSLGFVLVMEHFATGVVFVGPQVRICNSQLVFLCSAASLCSKPLFVSAVNFNQPLFLSRVMEYFVMRRYVMLSPAHVDCFRLERFSVRPYFSPVFHTRLQLSHIFSRSLISFDKRATKGNNQPISKTQTRQDSAHPISASLVFMIAFCPDQTVSIVTYFQDVIQSYWRCNVSRPRSNFGSWPLGPEKGFLGVF